jgi:hypothetical protein
LDPDGSRYGVPTYPWGWSRVFDPDLATKSQLRREGLSIAGLEMAAQLMWASNRAGSVRGVRTAALYRRSQARPVRPLTPRQERALNRALLARHTCRDCERLWPWCLPTGNGGRCPDGCEPAGVEVLAVAA